MKTHQPINYSLHLLFTGISLLLISGKGIKAQEVESAAEQYASQPDYSSVENLNQPTGLSPQEKEEIQKTIEEEAEKAARKVLQEEIARQKEEKTSSKKGFIPGGNFMDTRITWILGDDDFLADAGEKIPDSPLLSIGDREGYELFMDNIDSRYTGRETLTHLVMYSMMPAFIPMITTEASLVLKFQISEKDVDMADDGTYIRLHYHFFAPAKEDGIYFVFFPFDTERFRLGYLWDISWGGGAIFTNKRNGWAPGAKFGICVGNFNAFTGFKTAKVSQMKDFGPEGQPLNIQETNYGFLGGAGYDFLNAFKIDIGGGYFQQGTFDFEGIRGKPVYSFGTSLRLSFHRGMEVGLPADFALYRNFPEAEEIIATPETYKKGGWGIVVALEGTAIVQHLSDPDNYKSTVYQPAYAASGQVKIKIGHTRLHLTIFTRTLEFILHNVPSFEPFVAIPKSVDVAPEFFVAAGFDHYFSLPRITPGIILGVQLPATYSTKSSDGSLTTIVVRSEDLRDILVRGDRANPIFSGRISLKFDISSILSFVAFVQYVRDTNRTKLKRDELGTYRVYISENELGAALVIQAKF